MNSPGIRVMAVAATGVALISGFAWFWLWPVSPVDTPYFHWAPDAGGRYELAVSHVGANPEFRRGVETPPVPQSGTLRVVGAAGAAEPGAIVEVSNPRTRRAFATTTDPSGAFSVAAEARRGDTLKVISRRIRFRPLGSPRAQGVHQAGEGP